MNTPINDTIALLVKDTTPPFSRQKIVWALILLFPASIGLTYLASICTDTPIRADYFSALRQSFVLAKQAIPALLILGLLPILAALFRPESKPQRTWLYLLGIAGIIDILIITELITQPAHKWGPLILGNSLPQCLIGISVIASASLGITLYILRQGAVTHPILSGFLAGLLAGALGVFLYAFLCTEDSPLFYGIWYSLAVLLMGGFGAILGQKILRW